MGEKCRKYRSLVLCVVRVTKDNQRFLQKDETDYKLAMSKPCTFCQKTMYPYVKKIYYTDVIDGKHVLCEMRRN